jgi:hypothetical protein
MSFVDCYLPYFRQQLITSLLLALLPFQPLFTESSHGDQLLDPPTFSGVLSVSLPLSCVLVFSSLFIVQVLFWFFCGEGVSLPRKLCWYIPGVTEGILHDAWSSPFWYANISQAGLELASGGGRSPSVFSG